VSKKVMLEVWDCDLPHPEKIVLGMMAYNADEEGDRVFPGVDTISRRAGYSSRQVQRIIRKLERQGILILTLESNHRFPNNYRIDLSEVKKLPPRVTKCRSSRAGQGEKQSNEHSGVTSEPLGVTSETSGVTSGAFRGDKLCHPNSNRVVREQKKNSNDNFSFSDSKSQNQNQPQHQNSNPKPCPLEGKSYIPKLKPRTMPREMTDEEWEGKKRWTQEQAGRLIKEGL
jgi:hypothetical protein